MRMRRALWVVGLAACTVLGMGVSPAQASPAGAAGSQPGHTAAIPTAVVQPAFAPITTISQCSQNHPESATGVMVCFKPDGEHLGVCDTKADGHHVFVSWDVGGTGHRFDWFDGNGTCGDVNLDLPEGTEIFYEGCLAEGPNTLAGSCTPVGTQFA